MKKGKLVVIEGNDGSGKGTQFNLLKDYFKKNHITSSSFDFPQYEKTFFGNFVGHFLNGKFGHASRINPYLAMFPYAGDRWQVKKELDTALTESKVVICNRYAPSIAYQVAKVSPKERLEFIEWADTLEYKVFKIPREDLVIFLYVPFSYAHKLIETKDKRAYLHGKIKDQYEENVSYLEKVEKMYLWLYKNKKNWVKIDCVQNNTLMSREQIHKKIIDVLSEKGVI